MSDHKIPRVLARARAHLVAATAVVASACVGIGALGLYVLTEHTTHTLGVLPYVVTFPYVVIVLYPFVRFLVPGKHDGLAGLAGKGGYAVHEEHRSGQPGNGENGEPARQPDREAQGGVVAEISEISGGAGGALSESAQDPGVGGAQSKGRPRLGLDQCE